MKNKKSVLIGSCLIAAFVVLGVAYAISTVTLQINGTATVGHASDAAFDVRFTAANALADTPTALSTASIDATDMTGRTGVINVEFTSNATVNETQSAQFTIKNQSQTGITAKITKANIKIYGPDGSTPFDSSHFEVSVTGINDTEALIRSGETTNITVAVRLKTAHVGEGNVAGDDTGKWQESFVVKLEDISAQETAN